MKTNTKILEDGFILTVPLEMDGQVHCIVVYSVPCSV